MTLIVVRAEDVGDRQRIWLTGSSRPFLIMKSGAPLHREPRPSADEDGYEYTHAIVDEPDQPAPDQREQAFWSAAFCAALPAFQAVLITDDEKGFV